VDDQGLLPLHYACGAKCSREVIYVLLMQFPMGAVRGDPMGMLPLHYLGQWGPLGCEGSGGAGGAVEGSASGGGGVLEMMLVATGDLVNCKV
jgi:hypothetical protein